VTRIRRLSAVATLVAVLLSGAAGCGDDSPKVQGDRTRAATDPSSPTGPTSTSPAPQSTAPATPSVTPAAGLKLAEASSAVRVPAGWVKSEPILSYASAATDPGKLSSIQLVDSGDISGGAPLDVQARSAITTAPKGAHTKRLPDLLLDGVRAFHIHYTVPGDPQAWDVITTVRRGRNVGLDFILERTDAATNPDLIASVLATFHWTA
jgi:hypothetical protein